MQPDALYAYAVVAEDAPLPEAPGILPGAPLLLVREAGCAVLASPVPRAPFQDGPTGRMTDQAWLADSATAHRGVVAAASSAGPALPLAFGALFSAEAELRAWLEPRAAALRDALSRVAGCAEWSLRMEEDAAAHADWLDLHHPALREIGMRIGRASAGTAYLLGRRRMQLRAEARQARMQELSRRLAQRLRAHARALPAEMTALVEQKQSPALRSELHGIARELAGTGLALRLAGPWPAYASARRALEHG